MDTIENEKLDSKRSATRMAFRVVQSADSRTILDRAGAEQLIGRGDSLVFNDCALDRIQCAFIDISEIDALVEKISSQTEFRQPYYLPVTPMIE